MATTAVPPIVSSATGIKTGVCADGVSITPKTVTAAPTAAAGPPHTKVENPILPTLLSEFVVLIDGLGALVATE